MSKLRFVTLGVGNAFSALHYSSSIVVEANGTWLLVDCPHPIRKMMREASLSAGIKVDVADCSGVVLTHLHGDHVSGLEDFAFYLYYTDGKRRTNLLAHPNVTENLWTGHLAAAMEWSRPQPGEEPLRRSFEEFFKLQALDENTAVQIGPFQIECRFTVHSIPTTALRISAAGRTLGYSADTAFDSGLIEWLADADLIVHETGVGAFHTCYSQLAALPAGLRSKMRLIHYADDFDVESSIIEPLQQGICCEV